MHSKRASPSENTVKVTDVGIKYPPPKKKKKSDLLFLSWNLSLRNTMIKKQDKSCLTNMKLTP